MFIIDKPYVSELLKETAENLRIPVLLNEMSSQLENKEKLNLLNSEEFAAEYCERKRLYSNSENCISWVADNLNCSDLYEKISVCKDKYEFRMLLKDYYPDYFFAKAGIKELTSLNTSDLKFPLILKPSVGFFSMAVERVNSADEWQEAVQRIEADVKRVKGLYPDDVMNDSEFILEQVIDGEEFAVDAYYDENGEPVILDILWHRFSGEEDTSDRIYTTSKDIILKYETSFLDFLKKVGDKAGFKNFPVHLELRETEDGELIPIELNPMRFAGWCVTDIAYYSFNLNTYEYFLMNKKPDWEKLFEGKEDKIYSLVLADMPSDINAEQIEKFDYEKFLTHFENPLHLREIDFTEYPVFAFLFTETTKGNEKEIDYMLHSDLKEFIQMK